MDILACDPGRTSGIAIDHDDQVETKVIKDPNQLYLLVYNKTKVWHHVVIEDFITSGHISSDGLYTVRMIGAVTALCAVRNIPLTIHAPGQRYPFLPQAKKLLAGSKHVIHEVDALAHLLRFKHGNQSGSIRQRLEDNFNSK